MLESTSLPVRTRPWTVALAGNPNTGKSTLFTALTGFRQQVGNYPGTTVEKRTARLADCYDETAIELIDLPGAYSLSSRAQDEAVVMDVLLGDLKRTPRPDAIVLVVDAANLSRNLFLTTQVLELGRPVVVALNMIDLADACGVKIDVAALARELGVPVVAVVATSRTGVDELRRAIVKSLRAPASSQCTDFPDCVCAEIDGLADSIAENGDGSADKPSRVEALQTLLDPGGYHERNLVRRCGRKLVRELADRRNRIHQAGESIAEVEARVRYAWIHRVVEEVQTHGRPPGRSATESVDRIVTQPVIGLLILVILLGICFQSVYTWAIPLMNGIDAAFSTLGHFVGNLLPAGAVQSLVKNGVIAGVGGVLIFIPQILVLFLFISILEDCGYMARAAFLLDRWMGLVGLNGRSFIPLLSSFACAVPGIMATRTIADRNDRFVTILIAPLMSCSARLPVYTLLIGAFIPATPLLGGMIGLQALTLLAFYFVGVAVAIPVGMILKRTVLKGETQSFLMELPTYKWPSPRTVLGRVYEQGREFCVSAGTIIVAVTIVVWALGYYPRSSNMAADYEAQRIAVHEISAEQHAIQNEEHGETPQMDEINESGHILLTERIAEINRQESGAFLRQSYLGRMGQWIEPVVEPLGWDWRIGMAAIASFPAREVVIATMGTIYNLGEDQDETSVGLRDRLYHATWPDGRPVFNIAVSLSIMVFFALCCQCGATLATIKRETQSWRWPVLAFSYMTILAYVGALITYQVASRLT